MKSSTEAGQQSFPRRPVMRYHGGKFRIASWIVEHFPEHDTYVELFGGAASVLLRKPRCLYEIYNDVDDEVVNVFRVLRDDAGAEALTRLLFLTPFARAELEASYEESPDPVERARRTIARSFMGFSSASVTKAHMTGFRGNAIRSRLPSAGDWANYPENIRAFVERLRGVCIESKPALDLIPQHDRPSTLFYADPPYPMSTRYAGAGRGDCYRHEMSDGDHERLAMHLRSVQGFVVISTYASALYDRLYAGWPVVDKATMGSGNKSSVVRQERLILSPRTAAALFASEAV